MKASAKYVLISATVAGLVAILVFQMNSSPEPIAIPSSSPIGSGSTSPSPEPSTEVDTLGPLEVPSGKLAISLELSDASHVGSFLRPGSIIAIFNTVTSPSENGLSVKETRVLLSQVQVIGIDSFTTAEDVDAGLNSSATYLVTVAVTQAEAEKLVHGVQTGALYFGLLSGGTKVIPGPGVTDDTIFAGVN